MAAGGKAFAAAAAAAAAFRAISYNIIKAGAVSMRNETTNHGIFLRLLFLGLAAGEEINSGSPPFSFPSLEIQFQGAKHFV